MTLLDSTAGGILRPEDVGPLIVQPVSLASRAFAVSTVVNTASKDYRLPIVAADPSAGWVAEGQEIPVTDADIDELIVTPRKVAGLTIVSRELANDSSPEATEVVGQGLSRDIAKKVDAAYFAAHTTNGPDGLHALADVTSIDATGALADLDAFAEAIAESENVGGTITSFVASPAVALELAQLKQFGATGSNVPLLGVDPSQPTRRLVQGVPLIVSPACSDNVVWAIPQQYSYVVLHDDVTLDVDASPFFTSDRVAVRATLRVGFGFPHPASLVAVVLRDPS
jgi:HK97 family phage major capsid protein